MSEPEAIRHFLLGMLTLLHSHAHAEMCFFKNAATSELDDTVGDIRAMVNDVQNEIIREVEGASSLIPTLGACVSRAASRATGMPQRSF